MAGSSAVARRGNEIVNESLICLWGIFRQGLFSFEAYFLGWRAPPRTTVRRAQRMAVSALGASIK